MFLIRSFFVFSVLVLAFGACSSKHLNSRSRANFNSNAKLNSHPAPNLDFASNARVRSKPNLPFNPSQKAEWLYEIGSQPIQDSKWGKVAAFQTALNQPLKRCGQPVIPINGFLDTHTQQGIAALASCKQFLIPHTSSRQITQELWRSLLPHVAFPSIHERARALSLTHEATDYDRVEWNYQTADDRSALTWGPYGATVGYGNEVRGILKILQSNDPLLLKNIFKEDWKVVQSLIQSSQEEGYRILKNIYASKEKRQKWKNLFRQLGALPETQQAYEAYALESNEWLKPALKRLYSLVPAEEATEVDYAFFLDLAIHMGISKSRINHVAQQLVDETKRLGRPLKPAERRQVISINLIPNQRRWDRLGRNVVYYVDELGFENLSEREKTAWKKRSNLKASQVGLSDLRKHIPKLF